MMNEKNTNNRAAAQWREWVREELERHAEKLEAIKQVANDFKFEMQEKINELKIEMLKELASLQTKQDKQSYKLTMRYAMVGFLGGAVPVTIALALKYL